MGQSPFILASEDPVIRLVIFAIIGVIWAVSSIINKLQKARAKAQPVVQSMRVLTPPPIPRVQQWPVNVQSQRQTNPPPVPPPAPRKPDVSSNVPTLTRLGPPATVAAPAIARWLTPRVMRKQYILTEVFEPPPSLREAGDEGPPGLTGP